MRINRGNIFSGGTQNVGQVVAGTNARAVMHVGSEAKEPAATSQELMHKLDALIRLLQANQSTLPDGANLVGDASRVATELGRLTPSKN